VCCSVLQCVAAYCSVLQSVHVQWVAVCSSTLHPNAAHTEISRKRASQQEPADLLFCCGSTGSPIFLFNVNLLTVESKSTGSPMSTGIPNLLTVESKSTGARSFSLLSFSHSCISLVYAYTLQHTATHCNTLQHTATHCNTLQHIATHVCCSVLCVEVRCSVL